jgi:hypothetical protein
MMIHGKDPAAKQRVDIPIIGSPERYLCIWLIDYSKQMERLVQMPWK